MFLNGYENVNNIYLPLCSYVTTVVNMQTEGDVYIV